MGERSEEYRGEDRVESDEERCRVRLFRSWVTTLFCGGLALRSITWVLCKMRREKKRMVAIIEAASLGKRALIDRMMWGVKERMGSLSLESCQLDDQIDTQVQVIKCRQAPNQAEPDRGGEKKVGGGEDGCRGEKGIREESERGVSRGFIV